MRLSKGIMLALICGPFNLGLAEPLFDLPKDGLIAKVTKASDMVVVEKRNLPPDVDVEKVVGGYAIISSNANTRLLSKPLSQTRTEVFAIKDVKSERYGISDGTIFIFPKDLSLAERIATDYGIVILDVFASAKMVQVSVGGPEDPFALVATLNQDERLYGAELNTNFGDAMPL